MAPVRAAPEFAVGPEAADREPRARRRTVLPGTGPDVSSDRQNSPVYEEFIRALPVEPDEGALTPSMLFLDPPDHDRLRRLANKAFTPRAVERLVPASGRS
jgi:cytochrome P450